MVATLCAFAVAVTPAMAHDFTGTTGKTSKAKGQGEQEFKFGVFKILCENSSGRGGGLKESPQKTFFLTVTYSHCSTEAHIGGEPFFLKTRFKTPVSYEYHANGFVESGSESIENVTLSGGAVEMKVAGLKCIIDWEAQTIPIKAESKPEGEYSSATFTNIAEPTAVNKKFPDGFKHKVSISNALKTMAYEYEEGACEEFEKTEGKNGQYKGDLLAEINAGNLEFS
jgi:hypothetical protein